jgi:hypothetical protein
VCGRTALCVHVTLVWRMVPETWGGLGETVGIRGGWRKGKEVVLAHPVAEVRSGCLVNIS